MRKFLGAFVAGIAAGAVVALLNPPKRRSSVREKVCEQAYEEPEFYEAEEDYGPTASLPGDPIPP
jgi:gas vesicle protein